MEKGRNFLTDQVKNYTFDKWKRDCGWQWPVADIPWPFGIGIRLSKKDEPQSLSSRAIAKILNVLNNSHSAATSICDLRQGYLRMIVKYAFLFLKGRIHWNFSFRGFHEIQFQGHFMKHEILSWITFTLVSNIHCVCFSSIKTCVCSEKMIIRKGKKN